MDLSTRTDYWRPRKCEENHYSSSKFLHSSMSPIVLTSVCVRWAAILKNVPRSGWFPIILWSFNRFFLFVKMNTTIIFNVYGIRNMIVDHTSVWKIPREPRFDTNGMPRPEWHHSLTQNRCETTLALHFTEWVWTVSSLTRWNVAQEAHTLTSSPIPLASDTSGRLPPIP